MPSSVPKNAPAEILSVEDNRADTHLIREVFRAASSEVRLNFVSDGEEAMDYLLQKGKYAQAIRPDLVLLDLNLPRKDGRQFLQEVKAMKELKHIPTIVLTTSNSEKDIEDCYEAHANAYLIKPLALVDYRALASSIVEFWVRRACLPPSKPKGAP